MPTNPITTLAELDEALATLREPKPSEPLPYDALPHQCHSTGGTWGWDGVGEWVNTFRPTTHAADALALLRSPAVRPHWRVVFELCEQEYGEVCEIIDRINNATLSRVSAPFCIAASIAVARACGLSVELEDV